MMRLYSWFFDRITPKPAIAFPEVVLPSCGEDCACGDVSRETSPADNADSTASTRFFWWSADGLTFPWRPLYWGYEENCNRTLGIRLPGGVLFVCLNIPLRQAPCDRCST